MFRSKDCKGNDININTSPGPYDGPLYIDIDNTSERKKIIIKKRNLLPAYIDVFVLATLTQNS